MSRNDETKRVWLSALFGDGKSPREKYIVCDSEGIPLLFDTQLYALHFWMEYKERFEFPTTRDPRFDRVSPQVIRDGDPDGILNNIERKQILPKRQYSIYSDEYHNPIWNDLNNSRGK